MDQSHISPNSAGLIGLGISDRFIVVSMGATANGILWNLINVFTSNDNDKITELMEGDGRLAPYHGGYHAMIPLLHTHKPERGCSLRHSIRRVGQHSHASILRQLKPAKEMGVRTGASGRGNII